jgi:hypothetical protein
MPVMPALAKPLHDVRDARRFRRPPPDWGSCPRLKARPSGPRTRRWDMRRICWPTDDLQPIVLDKSEPRKATSMSSTDYRITFDRAHASSGRPISSRAATTALLGHLRSSPALAMTGRTGRPHRFRRSISSSLRRLTARPCAVRASSRLARCAWPTLRPVMPFRPIRTTPCYVDDVGQVGRLQEARRNLGRAASPAQEDPEQGASRRVSSTTPSRRSTRSVLRLNPAFLNGSSSSIPSLVSSLAWWTRNSTSSSNTTRPTTTSGICTQVGYTVVGFEHRSLRQLLHRCDRGILDTDSRYEAELNYRNENWAKVTTLRPSTSMSGRVH